MILIWGVKIAGHTIGQSNTRQATSAIGNAVAAEVKSTSRATRVVGSAALADKQCSDQATQRASTPALISTEVLEVIVAMPHHEFFIQEHWRFGSRDFRKQLITVDMCITLKVSITDFGAILGS